MTELIFIRHAETDLVGTFCGHSDPSINARGQAQVKDLIAELSHHPFDEIYSSDLRRAAETAGPLAQEFAIPLTTTANLREMHFGDWEGLTWDQIESVDAVFARRWVESFPFLAARGGEAFADFERRVVKEVTHLFHIAANKRIAVVTHGEVLRIVLSTLLGHTEQEAWDLTKSYSSHFVYARTDIFQEVSR